MRMLRSMIGMPILFKGKKLGRLAQAELSPDLKRMEGIWVDRGLKGTRYIQSEHLSLLGEHAIHSDDRGFRRRCGAYALPVRAVREDGMRIGAAVDAGIEELSFLVCALELSFSLWDDLITGRRLTEHFWMHPGDNRLIVRDPTEKDISPEPEREGEP